ncbi:hypothetical protein [Limisalsivibrio acetivorans]|uniref:hypothetical protein n=1 Tax=Limisalsivibrio acetivorans TaxID=1304888 RepID=UPI0003B52ED4|nr:hypothetical protein [Limisalsivibrio acetivorans]
MKNRFAVFLILASLLIFLGGCATVSSVFVNNLSVDITDIKVNKVDGFKEVDLSVGMFIRNDNMVPIYVTGLTYNAVVGKSLVATGKNSDRDSFMIGAKSGKRIVFDMKAHPKKAGQEFLKGFITKNLEMKVYGKIFAHTKIGKFTFNYSKTRKLE